ncbi:MAG: hypothetical protein AABX86_00380 [Nanoarchaeota archaeon]
MKYRQFVLLFAVFAALFASMAAVSAANFVLTQVEVNDVDMVSGKTLNVERDENLFIEVEVSCETRSDDARVRARIDGYEFGTVEDITPIFECNPGQTYKKTLNVHVPYDIDASQRYSLRVEAFDRIDSTERVADLVIEEQRHNVNLFDIVTNPTQVRAGSPVFVTVRIENLGYKAEDNVKVTANIPELGVSSSGYLQDDLITEDEEERERFDDDDEQSTSITLMLRIPEDAATGTYTVDVVAEFNRGHDFITGSKPVFVQAQERPVQQAEALITVDSSSKQITAGEETGYRIMIANIGGEAGLYTVEVDGVDSWGYSRVEPAFTQVRGGSTGEVWVFVKARPDAQEGTYNFVGRVMEGTQVVKELVLHARVEQGVEQKVQAVDLRVILAALFILLVVVLIVLAVILTARKANKGKPEEVSGTTTTTTYY